MVELGRLYHQYATYTLDPAVRQCVLDSLECRWSKADQDPFILAVFLNPFLRACLFNPRNTSLNRSSIYGIVKRVFRCVFRRDNDLELHEAFMDYYEGRGEFHSDKWDYKELKASYDKAVSENST